MDQIKIGRFIAACRKQQNLTQMQLAEKLGITDRAVSKWERGKGLPDASLMLDLCSELKISVNELLSGEVIEMTQYNQKAEQQLLEMAKEREEKDKALLHMEILLGVLATAVLLICIFVANFAPMPTWAQIVLIISGVVPFIIGVVYAIRIEQIAGFYECEHCHHKYVPKYTSVFFSPHYGRTRLMQCPQCGKRSWQKKSIRK